ncbi:hypothetical protein CW669_10750 [Macrococcoides caseolyticum]|nr:hypothetical protein CW669_10750 [Macrococcus caseolyticus]
MFCIYITLGNLETKASTTKVNTESEKEKLIAKELEFLYTKVFIKDEMGNTIDVNLDNAKKQYGEVPNELIELKNNLQQAKQETKKVEKTNNNFTTYSTASAQDSWDRVMKSQACQRSKLVGWFKGLLPNSIATQVIAAAQNHNYQKAAKLTLPYFKKIAIKSLIRGGVVGFAASLEASKMECDWKHKTGIFSWRA